LTFVRKYGIVHLALSTGFSNDNLKMFLGVAA